MKTRVSLLIAWLVVTLPSLARACAVCFSGDDDPFTHALNWSVFFLLASPYAIVGSIAACLVVAYRRAAAKRDAEDREFDQLGWNQEDSAR